MKSTMVSSTPPSTQPPSWAKSQFLSSSKSFMTITYGNFESPSGMQLFVPVTTVRVGKTILRPKRVTLDPFTYYEKPGHAF